jgi:4-alpha-glucanotransferase
MASVSKLCIIPMQDYLNLGAQARMNFPGTQTAANWTWRADEGFACDALADKIYQMTKLFARLGADSES